MAAVVLYWKSNLNGVKPPSITMLENDFCKHLKYFKHIETQHEFTDRCVSHFNISFIELSVFEKQQQLKL